MPESDAQNVGREQLLGFLGVGGDPRCKITIRSQSKQSEPISESLFGAEEFTSSHIHTVINTHAHCHTGTKWI